MNSQQTTSGRVAVAARAIFLSVCTIIASGTLHAETSLSKTPQSYEFKVLLNNSNFVTDRYTAMNEFMCRLKANAKRHDASVVWKEPDTKQREVRYLDTSDKAMRKHDLIFRTRIQMKKSCQSTDLANCDIKDTKVTLKQRFGDGVDKQVFDMTPDKSKATAFNGQKMKSTEKFEQDDGWKSDCKGGKTVIRKRSQSSSVKSKDVDGREQVRRYTTLGDVKALYPEVPWSTLGVSLTAALVPTCSIGSTVVKVGTIVFDTGNSCDASFTFWRNQDDQTSLASEFSFSCDNSGGVFGAVNDRVEAVFKELIEDPFVNIKPSTKTVIAYNCAGEAVIVDECSAGAATPEK
jgi:hypothetical protein